MLIERLMVLKMATTCRRPSTQTTWTQQELKSTGWLCRLAGGRATPVNGLIWLPCISCLEVVFLKSAWILAYTETSHRTISLKFAVLPVAWSSACGPSFLSLNMIHGAVLSLSLINNETNSKEKTLRHNLQLGYLSHYYCERVTIF